MEKELEDSTRTNSNLRKKVTDQQEENLKIQNDLSEQKARNQELSHELESVQELLQECQANETVGFNNFAYMYSDDYQIYAPSLHIANHNNEN